MNLALRDPNTGAVRARTTGGVTLLIRTDVHVPAGGVRVRAAEPRAIEAAQSRICAARAPSLHSGSHISTHAALRWLGPVPRKAC